ncbi:MAG: hypothetical protein AB7O67_18105 [Vicinamibacterales bacterium]
MVTFTLKPLSSEAIPAALAKAERYRLLNEPEQAESICEDILRTDPANQPARIMLLLALTDQFAEHEGLFVTRAQELADGMAGAYERAYFSGIIAERRARAIIARGGHGATLPAGRWLRDAMQHFELADASRPPGNDEARLRWNACARLAMTHPNLVAVEEGRGQPIMLE